MKVRTLTGWTVFFLAAALVVGCDEDDPIRDEGPIPVATKNIDSEGGTIEVTKAASPIYGAAVEVPAGALDDTETIEMFEESALAAHPGGQPSASGAMRIEPENLSFEAPATLTALRTAADTESGAALYRKENEAWHPLLPTTMRGDSLSAPISNLGTFQAFRGFPSTSPPIAFQPEYAKLDSTLHADHAFGECAFVLWFWDVKTRGNVAPDLNEWVPYIDEHAVIAQMAQQGLVESGDMDPDEWMHYKAPDDAIAFGLQLAMKQADAAPQLIVVTEAGLGFAEHHALLVCGYVSEEPLTFLVYDPYCGDVDKTAELAYEGGTFSYGTYTTPEFAHLYGFISDNGIAALSKIYDDFTEVDLTPPGQITDLEVHARASTSVTLLWSAPGDDGDFGQATSYDIRYSDDAPTAPSWWDEATSVIDPPAPAFAGEEEEFEVTGLLPSRTYYFAIKTTDEAGNTAEMSNIVEGRTFPDQIAVLIAAARQSLENELYEHLRYGAPNPNTPDDVDFTEAWEYYHAALDLEPDHQEARFGTALTGLMALSMDAEVNDAFDEWKAFIEETGPFNVELESFSPMGIPMGLAGASDPTALPFSLVSRTALAFARFTTLEADPKLSAVQDILLETVMPELETALGYLDDLSDESNFIFWVTALMQGDIEEDPLELDQTDVLALAGGCHLLMAGIHAAVAYDISVASYDIAGIHGALDQDTGTMCKLRLGGAAHMQAVLPEFDDAVTKLDTAITTLLAEGDDQSDDWIKIGPRDLDRQEVLDWQATHLPKIQAALMGPTTHTLDWDDDNWTPDAPLTVDLHAFFTNPVEDFKLKAAPYTIEIENRGWMDMEWLYYSENAPAVQLTIPEAGYYSASFSIEVDDYQDEPIIGDNYGDEPILGAIAALATAKLSELVEAENWGGDASVYINYYGELPAGLHSIAFRMSIYTNTAKFIVSIPVVVWEADTYEEWSAGFPDPTINGLLPNMTRMGDFLELFNPEFEDEWEKRLELDWTEANY